jgi:hypothetical protein
MAKADEDVGVKLGKQSSVRTVLADETPRERCELEPTWQTYSIPESVAREHFGLTLHAELYTDRVRFPQKVSETFSTSLTTGKLYVVPTEQSRSRASGSNNTSQAGRSIFSADVPRIRFQCSATIINWRPLLFLIVLTDGLERLATSKASLLWL